MSRIAERQSPGSVTPATDDAAAGTVDRGSRPSAANELLEGLAKNVIEHAKSNVPQNLYQSISADLGGFIITDYDSSQVVAKLEQLGPEAYGAAIKAMDKDGNLQKLMEQMPRELREQFLEQGHRKGLLKKEPADPVVGRFDPPQMARKFVNDPELPFPMRAAIYHQLRDDNRQYAAAYAQYQARYAEAIANARSGEEVRDIGRWVDPQPRSETFPAGDPNGEHIRQRGDTPPNVSTSKGVLALAAKMAELRGEDGSITLKASNELKIDGPAGGASIKREVSVSDQGFKEKISGKGEVKEGPFSSSAEYDSEGKLKSRVGITNVAEAEVDDQGVKSVEVNLGIGSVSVDRDGAVELKTAKFGVPGTGVHIQGKVKADPKNGAFGADVAVAYAVGEASVGVEVNGVSDLDREMFVKPHGAYDRPPELDSKIKWDALPAARQRELVFQGWNAEEWARRSAKR